MPLTKSAGARDAVKDNSARDRGTSVYVNTSSSDCRSKYALFAPKINLGASMRAL